MRAPLTVIDRFGPVHTDPESGQIRRGAVVLCSGVFLAAHEVLTKPASLNATGYEVYRGEEFQTAAEAREAALEYAQDPASFARRNDERTDEDDLDDDIKSVWESRWSHINELDECKMHVGFRDHPEHGPQYFAALEASHNGGDQGELCWSDPVRGRAEAKALARALLRNASLDAVSYTEPKFD